MFVQMCVHVTVYSAAACLALYWRKGSQQGHDRFKSLNIKRHDVGPFQKIHQSATEIVCVCLSLVCKTPMLHDPRCEKTVLRGFQAVQLQKMARGLKFRI